MQIGMIGLGKMGANMAERLMQGGHTCVAYDLNADHVKKLEQAGAQGALTLEELAMKLSAPRIVWVMVPQGKPTEDTVLALSAVLEAGDTVINGGNSHYKDDLKYAELLKPKKIHFVDAGTSGGVWGKERGYCLMIGADQEVYNSCEPIFKTLAPKDGCLYCGPVGSGHFVKMIHNGIEYGLMQAYAEGFDILKNSKKFKFDLEKISEVWRHGSVIGSWLLDLTAAAFKQDPELEKYTGHVADSGEGRWTVEAAIESGVSAEVISIALFKRFRSRQEHSFAEKTLSAMRFQFGGHVE